MYGEGISQNNVMKLIGLFLVGRGCAVTCKSTKWRFWNNNNMAVILNGKKHISNLVLLNTILKHYRCIKPFGDDIMIMIQIFVTFSRKTSYVTMNAGTKFFLLITLSSVMKFSALSPKRWSANLLQQGVGQKLRHKYTTLCSTA